MRKNGGWRWREARPVDDGLAMSRVDGDAVRKATHIAHESGGQHG